MLVGYGKVVMVPLYIANNCIHVVSFSSPYIYCAEVLVYFVVGAQY